MPEDTAGKSSRAAVRTPDCYWHPTAPAAEASLLALQTGCCLRDPGPPGEDGAKTELTRGLHASGWGAGGCPTSMGSATLSCQGPGRAGILGVHGMFSGEGRTSVTHISHTHTLPPRHACTRVQQHTQCKGSTLGPPTQAGLIKTLKPAPYLFSTWPGRPGWRLSRFPFQHRHQTPPAAEGNRAEQYVSRKFLQTSKSINPDIFHFSFIPALSTGFYMNWHIGFSCLRCSCSLQTWALTTHVYVQYMHSKLCSNLHVSSLYTPKIPLGTQDLEMDFIRSLASPFPSCWRPTSYSLWVSFYSLIKEKQ